MTLAILRDGFLITYKITRWRADWEMSRGEQSALDSMACGLGNHYYMKGQVRGKIAVYGRIYTETARDDCFDLARAGLIKFAPHRKLGVEWHRDLYELQDDWGDCPVEPTLTMSEGWYDLTPTEPDWLAYME